MPLVLPQNIKKTVYNVVPSLLLKVDEGESMIHIILTLLSGQGVALPLHVLSTHSRTRDLKPIRKVNEKTIKRKLRA